MKTAYTSRNDSAKHYTVKWEGTCAYRATRDDAIRDLWIARMTNSRATINTARDPGAVKSDNLVLSAFNDLPWAIKSQVLDALRDHYLRNIADWVLEIGGTRPEMDYDKANNQHFLNADGIECWCDAQFGLGRPFASYSVGINTGDDYNELLDTHAHLEAALKIAVLMFERQAREQMKGNT